MDRAQQASEVAGIIGVDTATASAYLAAANYNSELAISNYFDGIAPPNAPSTAPPASSLKQRCQPPPTHFYPLPVLDKPMPILRPDPHMIPPNRPVPIIGIPRPRPPFIRPPRIPPIEWLPIRTRLVNAKQQEVPLHGLNVVVNVVDFVAQVQVNHRFVNSESNPIEAIFMFQQDDASIYEFEVEIDGKRITSVCKEKEAAFNKYDDAIASGNSGFLLSKETEDEFKLNVGNLPPKSTCIIAIKYSIVLSTEGDAIQLSVPITRVPLRLWTHPTSIAKNEKYPFPNGVTLSANIKMASPIIGIECESHDIDYNVDGNTATLSLKGDPTTQPTKDFSIMIGLQDPHVATSAVVESLESKVKNSNSRDNSIMLSYYPDIESTEDDIPMEYVFLVDRSGSMSGSKNTQLINALQLFLRSIPMGSLFNIVGFGSRYENLFPNSIVYDDESFAKATEYAANVKANFAGTDILPPLYNILSKPVHPLFPRQVFILTDGEVNNTEEVIRMVRKNIGITRIFTLGIGAEASKRLVAGIAKAGKGQAEFATSGTRMEPKVLAQLKRAMQPHVSVEVDWGTLSADIKQAPAVLPPIFPGDPIVVFGLLNREVREGDSDVALKVKALNQPARVIPVSLPLLNSSLSGQMIGVLAASCVVSDVERKLSDKTITEAEAKATIIPLATKYSLVTKYTSLVAEEVRDDPVEGTMQVRTIGEMIPPPLEIKPPQPIPHSGPVLRGRGGSRGFGNAAGGRYVPPAYPTSSSSSSFSYSSPSSSLSSLSISRSSNSPSSSSSASFGAVRKPVKAMAMKEKKQQNTNNNLDGLLGRKKCSVSFDYDDHDENDSEEEEKEANFDYLAEEESAPSFYQSAPAPPPPAAAPSPSPSLSSSLSSTSSFTRVDPNIRPLDKFIVLQQASGNWSLSASFLQIINKTQSQLENIFGNFKSSQWESNIIATALAIVFLELTFADSEDEWSLLRDKAYRWSNKELQKNAATKSFADYVQFAYSCFTK